MVGRKEWLGVLAVLAVATLAATAQADIILQQNFNSVTGVGGGTFLVGAGFNWQTNWDNGITGEYSFGGTTGNARVGSIAAYGTVNGGKNGTGGGVIDVAGVNFNIVDETFEIVSGTGGGTFLTGNGSANTAGYTPNWDDGIVGEQAFAGTFGGAAILTGGGASAQGLPTGGMGGGGGGRVAMSNVTVGSGHWYAGVMWSMGPFPGAAPFYNPGFEQGLNNWAHYGNVFAEPASGLGPMTPHSGNRVLKMYGTFPGNSGAYQAVRAQAGQVWSLAAYTGHRSTDAITGTQNRVDMVIEFRDSGGVLIDSGTVTILDGTSPTNQWIATAPFQRTAPAGTALAQVVFIFVSPVSAGGAGLVDDVTFVGTPPGVNLSQHALTANILGAANGSGSVPGDYQLRIEDPAGNRLIFRGLTNGTWQSIGGPLSTAIEADPNGTPASGVFNVNSPSFQVVLAMDDEYTHRWGTGGMLTFDNIRLSNTDSTGSAWYAGLDWPGLLISQPDLSQLRLTADVLGSVVGGNYELRIEAMKNVTSSLDQNFNTVTGLCGPANDCVLLDANDVVVGTYFVTTTDWDTGITGEGAYGGVYGGTDIWNPGGISARGRTTGGVSNTGYGEIRVENMILGAEGSGWYAGLQWGSQHLASTDLSQVTLRADIKGIIATGGSLGNYELRIEDAEGDRLYFAGTATGAWQTVGGLLSTATPGPALNGGGDGTFDLDSPSYNVVVAFADEAGSWVFGGVLAVDNLYLTPANTQRELGRISFPVTANGSWQSVGGILATGTTTFTTMNENFNTVTGVGGGEFWASGGNQTFGGRAWDTGISGEETFAGTWGTGTLATENAWGCTNCGVSASGAGNVSVTGAGGGASGGWWAGLTWVVGSPDWSDPNQVFCTAQVKASKLAPYQLRVEDGSAPPSNPVWLGFMHTPTSTTNFESVGGPMSQGVWSCPNPPCAAFNYNAPYYRVTLIYSGGTADTTWGTGGTLTVDNLFFTQIGFGDADSYTATLTFDNELATWGDHGRLTVDNLGLQTGPLVCHGDLNCDGSVSFRDINPFVLYLSSYSTWAATYTCGPQNGDINGDGTYPSFKDINPFVSLLSSTALPIHCP